jgi:hypothetical protein
LTHERFRVFPRFVRTRLCDEGYVGERVLIVDKHEEFRILARALLQAEGFEVGSERDKPS